MIQLRNRKIVRYSQGKKSINRRLLIVFFRTVMMRLLLVTNISLVSFFSFYPLLSINYILWTLSEIFLGNPRRTFVPDSGSLCVAGHFSSLLVDRNRTNAYGISAIRKQGNNNQDWLGIVYRACSLLRSRVSLVTQRSCVAWQDKKGCFGDKLAWWGYCLVHKVP